MKKPIIKPKEERLKWLRILREKTALDTAGMTEAEKKEYRRARKADGNWKRELEAFTKESDALEAMGIFSSERDTFSRVTGADNNLDLMMNLLDIDEPTQKRFREMCQSEGIHHPAEVIGYFITDAVRAGKLFDDSELIEQEAGKE